MKKLFQLLLLFFVTSACFCQEKIVEKYTVQVTYVGGGTEKIEVKNNRCLKVPAPVVKEGSIFYDEEYLLNDVKSIKILETVYGKHEPAPKNKYAVRKVTYWSYKYQRYVNLNIIYDPEAERIQREAERNGKSIFAPSTEIQIDDEKNKSNDTINQPEKRSVDMDTVVVSTRQIVTEFDGKENFKRIENSGIKLVGNMINMNEINLEFDRIDIGKKTDEYLELSQIISKKGIYLIEKQLNKDNQAVLYRILPIRLVID